VEEGANVVLVDVNEAALSHAVDAVGSERVSFVVANVTNPEDTQRFIRAAVDRHGRIDVFLANAGIEGVSKPLQEYPLEVFDQVWAVNVRGVFLGLQHVIPIMADHGGGSIVITSSVFGYKGNTGSSVYSASKHAVIGLMRSAAIECAPLGIRVNAINPAYIDGPMMQRVVEAADPDASQQLRERLQRQVPLARYGTPDEVAHLLVFLASDESRFCTGGIYPVDGGMSAR
jgi:NAD(P)-dependent dehydrogenase (short-subunit alcohol dehydrogenase family)